MAELTVPITTWEKGTEYKVTVPIYTVLGEGEDYTNTYQGLLFSFLSNEKILWTQEELDAYVADVEGASGSDVKWNDYFVSSWADDGTYYSFETDDVVVRVKISDANAWDEAENDPGTTNFNLNVYVTVKETSSLTSGLLALVSIERYFPPGMDPAYNTDVTEEDAVEITVVGEEPGFAPIEDFPAARPVTYDPDLWWSEEDSEWTAVVTGGGNYNQQLVAISDDGNIFYG